MVFYYDLCVCGYSARDVRKETRKTNVEDRERQDACHQIVFFPSKLGTKKPIFKGY